MTRPFKEKLTRLDVGWMVRETPPALPWIIEGLAVNGKLDPMQEAFWNEHGLQCGFCTPGMIMTAKQIVERNPKPTDQEIRQGLEGNLCRCTGYQHIVNAVKAAAAKGSADAAFFKGHETGFEEEESDWLGKHVGCARTLPADCDRRWLGCEIERDLLRIGSIDAALAWW